MTNLINKVTRANKLLMDCNLTIISDVNNELKCGICKNILNIACQTDCGCNFCKKCIDDYKNNGEMRCPGNSQHCGDCNLIDIVLDRKTNRQILELIVRCGNENCDFECELMNMEMHMETCSKKKVNCLFEIVGCEDKLIGDKLNDHFQLNNYSHSKLLLDTINNLRNEVKELKENEKMNKTEISMLKIKMEEQKEEIETMKNEMIIKINCKEKKIFETIKDVKEMINVNKDKMGISDQIPSLVAKIEEIIKINDRNKKELDIRTTRNNERIDSIYTEIELNKINIENVKNDMVENIKQDIKSMKMEIEKMEIKINNVKRKEELERKSTMNRLEKFLNTGDGIFLWNIGIINNLESNNYFSEFFYNKNNPYKLGLGWFRCKDGRLIIRVLIYCGASDDDLDWPFKATITIKVSVIFDQNKTKSITKDCTINRPMNNLCQSSEEFLFEKSELLNHPSIIECAIDYNK